MKPITQIDPLSLDIKPIRAIEISEVTKEFSKMAALTIRQERDIERLLTAVYIAGAQDAVATHE